MSTQLISQLQNPTRYAHDISYFKVVETHISWVILTGSYAYKIKKPMNFEFLDFTTLEKRKHYCEKELELNKRLAPELYLEVIAITGTTETPTVNGNGKAIEYALKMREFPQENLFTQLLQKKQLTPELIIETAKILAEFHLQADTHSPEYFGSPEQINEAVIQNFDQIKPLLSEKQDQQQLTELLQLTEQQNKKLYSLVSARKRQGFIRACHGDIHLSNITLFKNKPVIFDCIEFNESFRWTDTMADVGFMMMDLHFNHRHDFANQFINAYLQITGDYHALNILPYYQAYRAMVRAKITMFELQQAPSHHALLEKYRRYIELANQYIQVTKPKLFITHGFSASGKSTLAKFLVEKLGLIQIRSDIERKRLAGLSTTAASQSRVFDDLYHEKINEQTYQRLYELTETCLSSGYSVIVDATFLKPHYREQFSSLAKQFHIPFKILYCRAPLNYLLTSLDERKQQGEKVSEAYPEVLLAQQSYVEPLTPEELTNTLIIDTNKKIDSETILAAIADSSER